MTATITTFDKCVNIRELLLTLTAESLIYDWDNSSKISNIKSITFDLDKLSIKHNTSYVIDPNDLSVEQAIQLGFKKYDLDTNEIIYLIPLWLFPFLKEDIKVISISNKLLISKIEMNTDHRGGLLAYGITK